MSSNRSQGVIHACVSNKTGAVRIVGRSRACQHARRGHPGERALVWSQGGPSDAYYAFGAPDSTGSVSVKVPPGDYIATGGCTANLDQTAGSTVPSFGMAVAALTTDPNFFISGAPAALARASVPNEGDRGGPILPAYGSATLSNSTGFRFPHGGRIFETCYTDPGVHGYGGSSAGLSVIDNQYVTAIRVGTLHQG